MKSTDLISIIIPVYNMEKRVKKCLQTVIEQTYQNLEIIVVNDGSTDNSLQLCREFEKMDNRVHVIDQKNMGVSSARNTALDNVSGNYVAFIDSDDYVSYNYIQILYETLLKNNADIVECGAIVVNEVNGTSDKIVPRFQLENNRDQIISSFYRNEGVNDYLWNKLFKKELFNEIRFSNFKCSEDFEILCHILQKSSRIASIDTPLYYYIRNNDSIGLSSFSEKKLDVIKARESIYQYYFSNGEKKWSYMIAVQILSQIITLYSQLKVSDKEYKKHRNYLLKKFKEYYPAALREKHSLKKDVLRRIKFKLFLISPAFFCKIAGMNLFL